MIPKIIHYVWVGNNSKPELVYQCMQTWKQYCPDYEIMEWGNDCMSEFENVYVQQAYTAGKYAFVSDYIRLYALEKFGGFYFDADLEITRPIDEFRNLRFVTGFEKHEKIISPVTAFMGSEKNNQIVKDLLTMYDGIRFNNDGVYDMVTNTARISEYFRENFVLPKNHSGSKLFILDEKCHVYPYFYFCTPIPNLNNYAIHHFEGSWIASIRRKELFSVSNLKLVKFSFKQNLDPEDQELPLSETERLICSYTLIRRKGKRTYSVVQKNN